ncbi:membrane dipeptidase [Streptoalloteichus tenebrarius]|uniref:Membrane dipeptidase n=1 Tax=Streptoalloteichus tenebrarius (strain ATCC 17920 / DSM 40477 / JCM 4838 / CBS 697.72 / NBRC 16177 / NCIMB 11028 / NRRL B-12390 / A12253. 1 / ISP 5477) TaxID=1933 RepID=A0ABT1HS20_STRSD|nr:dipeptidase [Streptoalloteichus tenebrarius]MCP2258309.1 membrane dipeptidase [Streptoalloteichus tenebrarius]
MSAHATGDAFARARDLLRRAPVVDGHNDLPWALRRLAVRDDGRADFTRMDYEALDRVDLTREQPGLHTDLPRLRRGGVGAQFWSVYVPCHLTGHAAVTAVLEQVELVHELVARHPDHLALATTADEAERALAEGRIASLLGAEGGHAIAESLGVLRALHRLGVRYLTLTHNENVPWADSATDEPVAGGLTDFGRDVVREMNRLGMLVDLSHVAATTMRDALTVSRAPVVFSHSSCRAVADNPRNVPDDVLARLADNGGVCMITFVPAFVSAERAAWEAELRAEMTRAGEDYRDLAARAEAGRRRAERVPRPGATLDQVVEHVEHAREVAGIDHIGLGGDYDGVDEFPPGLEDVSGYPAVIAALLDRGWSEEDCAKLSGRNVLRVLREAESVAAGLRES